MFKAKREYSVIRMFIIIDTDDNLRMNLDNQIIQIFTELFFVV